MGNRRSDRAAGHVPDRGRPGPGRRIPVRRRGSGRRGKAVPASSSPSLPAASADAPTPAEVTELWTGSLYTSTFRVGLCFSAQGKVRGVLHLRLANGQVDVYHFEGSVKDNAIEASHSSGHRFKGRLSAPDKVEGTISLKNGMKIKLEGKRVQDVPLASGDCAPLPD